MQQLFAIRRLCFPLAAGVFRPSLVCFSRKTCLCFAEIFVTLPSVMWIKRFLMVANPSSQHFYFVFGFTIDVL
jgi:hypothetical protein